MPLVARDRLGLGAAAFGTLMASFGVGAIAGALALSHAMGRKSLNSVVTAGIVLWALATALVAVASLLPLSALGAAGAGAAWVTVMSCLSTATQSTAPAWVRARAVATNLVTNQASLALGSIFWGVVAERAGVAITLGASAAALAVVLVVHRRVRVAMGEEADVTPGAKLPDLETAFEPGPDDGPVLIQIEYRIAPEHRVEFLAALHKVESIRRRNGASSWRVFHDLEQEGKFVERFVIESWAEYTRLRTRMTQADRRAQDSAERLQQPDVPIRVSRFIAVGRDLTS
jgi:MFS family permease